MDEKWIKEHPMSFLWLMSMLLVVIALPAAFLMNGGCALPFLAVGFIGSTCGALFAFMEWAMS